MTENNNLFLYNKLRNVPTDAQKEIPKGRLKGMTNINPMWRIKALTEQFGSCGIGWKYVITRQWTEAGANNEIIACCNIDMYIKYNGEWSEAIPGTGGSMLVAKETNGPHTSDECFKMALTDAISVAAKALGAGADVYWQEDRTKYDAAINENEKKELPKQRSDNKNFAPPKQERKEQRGNNAPEGTAPHQLAASPTVNSRGEAKISEKHMMALYALAETVGFSREQVNRSITRDFGVLDPREMTPEQFKQKQKNLSELVRRLHSEGVKDNA